MKNKTKKILAGACLGFVGMGCLTGCAMSDEQKAALDLITEKSDAIVNLLEENMEYNNKKLSKEEAAEKILIGRNVFKFANFDSFEMSMLQNVYYGVFDKFKDSYTKDETTPWRWIYRKDGDTKILATAEGEDLESIKVSDFSTDEHLEWGDGEDSFSSREYDTDDFVFEYFDRFLSEFVSPEITSEYIKDIVNTEKGYEFSMFVKSPDGALGGDAESRLTITNDGLITKWICKVVLNDEYDYTSYYVEFNFKYNDIDFSSVDAKIAELNS
jgi:hypothetical protein